MAAAAAAAGGAGAGAGDGEVLRPQCITEINNVPTFSSLVIRQAGGAGGQQQQQASVVIELEFEAARLDDGDNGAAAAAGAGGDDNNTANGARLMKFRGTAPVALADLDGSTTPIKLVLDRRDAENPAWDAHHPLFSAAAARVRLEHVRPAPAPVPEPEAPPRPSQVPFCFDMSVSEACYVHPLQGDMCSAIMKTSGAWYNMYTKALAVGHRYFLKVRVTRTASGRMMLGFAADQAKSLFNHSTHLGNGPNSFCWRVDGSWTVYTRAGECSANYRNSAEQVLAGPHTGKWVGLMLDLRETSPAFGSVQLWFGGSCSSMQYKGLIPSGGLLHGVPKGTGVRFGVSMYDAEDTVHWAGWIDDNIPANFREDAEAVHAPDRDDFL